MLKTYLYIPEFLNEKITLAALNQKKSKAEIIRQALEKGISELSQQGAVSAQALLRLAQVGEKFQPQGPKDLSANLNKYLWSIEENVEK